MHKKSWVILLFKKTYIRFLAGFLILGLVSQLALGVVTPIYSQHIHDTSSKPKSFEKVDKKLPQPAGAKGKTEGSIDLTIDDIPELDGYNQSTPITPGELTDLREPDKEVFLNEDGSFTANVYNARKYFEKDGELVEIDTTLVEDTNPSGDSAAGNAFGKIKSGFDGTKFFKIKENDWQARFAPSNDKVGMVRYQRDGQTLSFSPVDANNVVPQTFTDEEGTQYLQYIDLWTGVTVEYVMGVDSIKENIVLHDKNAINNVAFEIKGAEITESTEVEGAYVATFPNGTEAYLSPVNLIRNTFGYETDESVYDQEFKDGQLRIWVNKDYLQALPDEAFPVVVDPTTSGAYYSGNLAGGNYKSFKSDGYVCPAHICNPQAGTILDANYYWQEWRSAMKFPYTVLQGKNLISANLHLKRRTGVSFYTGNSAPHGFRAYRAHCLHSINCASNPSSNRVVMDVHGDLDVTAIYKNRIAAGDWGAWLMIDGDTCSCDTYRNFDPEGTYTRYTYTKKVGQTSPIAPANNEVITTDQPTLKVNTISAPYSGDQIRYYYRLNPSGSGTQINSGWTTTTRWTVPEGALQDGVTYDWYVYASVWVNGSKISQTNPTWKRSFKVNLRTGSEDPTQTYDVAGPISIATSSGNAATSASSHEISALGGSIGLGLEYNSPVRSKHGLLASYYNNTNRSGAPKLTRVESEVDHNWHYGSPSGGVIQSDNFSARWTGFFIAPETGNYNFGGSHDDNMTVYVNNVNVYSNGCCSGGFGSAVALSKGQVVPIRVDYTEGGGVARASLKVRGAVSERVIPSDWLRTEPRSIYPKQGLVGYYFNDNSSHTVPSDKSGAFASRVEPQISMNWGAGSPAANAAKDNWLATYEGYITVPTTGAYQFGTLADDAARVYINGNLVTNDWANNGSVDKVWGSNVTLTANESVPIRVDYYEKTGSAALYLYAKGAVNEQVVPANWLSNRLQVLPDGWELSMDADGSLSYDFAEIRAKSVVLRDASGSRHEYVYKDGVYKAPDGQYGKLTRNGDGTIRLEDADGLVYIFYSNGRLKEVSSVVDDRKPAALQFDYGNTPVRLEKIKDGVDPSRFGELIYSGDSRCPAVPGGLGFDSAPPANMLCAFHTTDGSVTKFFYAGGNLGRLELPGNEITDIGYDSLGRIAQHKSSLANEAVAAGVRPDDDSIASLITYDSVGRVNDITSPAATNGASRLKHSYAYFVGQNGSGATQVSEEGGVEPHGYSMRVEYDEKWRTTRIYDKQALASDTEWHATKDLVLSSTSPTGLKSTTIYNQSDLPIESHGPAPVDWFGADRRPLAAHAAEVPRVDTAYDEGFQGPAVTYFHYDPASKSLIGTPKARSTNLINHSASTVSRNFGSGSPIPGRSDNWGLSANGKIAFPQTGNYKIRIFSDNGVRLYLNNKLVVDDWNNGAQRNHPSYTFVNNTANKEYDFRLDYYHTTGDSNIAIAITPPGQPETYDVAQFIKPDYGLVTSTTAYDSVLGNSTTTTDYSGESGPPPVIDSNSVYTLYSEGLAPEWSHTWSWNSAIDLTSSAEAATGSHSISWSSTGNWGGMNLRSTTGPLDMTPYNSVSFDMKAAEPGQTASVILQDENWNTYDQFSIGPYGGALSDTEFTTYTVPLSAFGAQGKLVRSIEFVEESGSAPKTLYVDNIRFTSETVEDIYLYDDSLPLYNSIWTWNDTFFNWHNTESPHTGSRSIAVDFDGNWGGFTSCHWFFYDTTGYTSFSFALKTTSPDVKLSMRLTDDTGTGIGTNQPIEIWGGTPVAGGYTVYTIPLSHLDGVDRKICGFEIQEETGQPQSVMYFDDIRLTTDSPNPIPLYKDGFAPNQSHWTWNNTTVDLASTVAHEGTHAIGANYGGNWSGFTIYAWHGYNTTGYESLSFALRGSAANNNITIKVVDINGVELLSPGAYLSDYGGLPADGVYKEYEIPLSAMGGVNTTMYGITVQDETGQPQGQLYIDDIQLNPTPQDGNPNLPTQPTATTQTGPEYGIAHSATADAGGLNYVAYSTHEELDDPDGFLRQTSSISPGGNTTNFSYYDATEQIDNPCTTAHDPVSQAGRSRIVTEQDPDGSGAAAGRKKEVVYDAAGRIVASRVNSDPWTCIEFDEGGRAVQIVQPDINGRLGRTVQTIYAADGNPLLTRTIDSILGASEVLVDLLGRPVESLDIWGNTNTVTYDASGRVDVSTTQVGVESYDYDDYDRPVNYKLNGTILATTTYDQYSRIETIDYPEAKNSAGSTLKLTAVKRDSLQRVIGGTYQTSDGKVFDEDVQMSQGGRVYGATQQFDGQTINSSYSFDGIGRMTAATVGQTQFGYGYDDSTGLFCANFAGHNVNAHKNSNRTRYTVTNLTDSSIVQDDTYCHDRADRLVGSTDVQIGSPTYDDHHNTVSLAGNGAPVTFEYDAADHNIAIEQGSTRVEYVKTSAGAVVRKKVYENGVLVNSYRNIAGGRILQTCDVNDDSVCADQDTYIHLPGGVTQTIRSSGDTYSLKNFHGDTALILDDQAVAASQLLAYGPFGEPLIDGTDGAPAVSATNATDANLGWAAHPHRKIQGEFTLPIVQMGARVYLPTLGRFLQVDPVRGGTLNPYVYAHDPVNMNDYSGMYCIACLLQPAGSRSLQASGGLDQRRLTSSGTLRVSTPTTGRSTSRPVSVQSRPSKTIRIARAGTALSVIGDATGGVKVQASVYGRQLQQGSSTAGRKLPSVGRLAKNPTVRVVGKWAGPVGVGIEAYGNHLEGDGLARNFAETGGATALGAVGATAGGAACGAVSFGTGGLAAFTCPVLIGVGGGVGAFVGGRIGEGVADLLGW